MPQFYLRGFAANDRVTTVRLPGDRRFIQPVRKAGSENNFYTLRGHDDGPDVFEKMLAEIEGETATVFDKIVNGEWPLSPENRTALATFIALQAVRGPDHRRNMEHIYAQIMRLEIGYGGRAGVKGWAKRGPGVDLTEEQAEEVWQQATQPGGPPIRLAPIEHIREIAGILEELVPFVSGRPWMLLRFDKRSLITCDAPVGLVRHPDDEPWQGVGFMTAWGITYPLTRKLGLILTDPMAIIDQAPVEYVRSGNLDSEHKGTTEIEKFLNERTVASAGEWLYHHPDDERFVPEDLPDPRPVTMRMSGGPKEFSGEPLFGTGDDASPGS